MAMTTYHQYPKVLHHPRHQDAVWKKFEGKGKGLFEPDTVIVSTERFPNVTVSTLQQEQQYAAKGYRPANMPDPAEYEAAILDAQPMCGSEFQAFPKWKYSATELAVIVQNEQEEKALGAGWFDSPQIATEDDLVVEEKPVVEAGPVDEPPIKEPLVIKAKVAKRKYQKKAKQVEQKAA